MDWMSFKFTDELQVNLGLSCTNRQKQRSSRTRPCTWTCLPPSWSWRRRATPPRGRAPRTWATVSSARTPSRSPRWSAPPSSHKTVPAAVLDYHLQTRSVSLTFCSLCCLLRLSRAASQICRGKGAPAEERDFSLGRPGLLKHILAHNLWRWQTQRQITPGQKTYPSLAKRPY